MTLETIEDRADRAQNEELTATVVETNPLVVQVHNEDSDSIHTVVPSAGHCSGEDHTYRGMVCKHLLFLMQQDGDIGEITRESLKEQRNELDSQIDELHRELESVTDERDQITAALDAVGASHMAQSTVGEIVSGLEAEAEAREDDEFQAFVEDVTEGAE